jgi:RES domain-containing protein
MPPLSPLSHALCSDACRQALLGGPSGVVRTGTAWRCVMKEFAGGGRNPLSGKGAERNGARFTKKGAFPTLYISEDKATCISEFYYYFEAVEFPRPSADQIICLEVRYAVTDVLDLTTPEQLDNCNLTLAQLHEEWRKITIEGGTSSTQRLGETFHRYLGGIRYPSARRKGGTNLALFPDNYSPANFVKVLAQVCLADLDGPDAAVARRPD